MFSVKAIAAFLTLILAVGYFQISPSSAKCIKVDNTSSEDENQLLRSKSIVPISLFSRQNTGLDEESKEVIMNRGLYSTGLLQYPFFNIQTGSILTPVLTYDNPESDVEYSLGESRQVCQFLYSQSDITESHESFVDASMSYAFVSLDSSSYSNVYSSQTDRTVTVFLSRYDVVEEATLKVFTQNNIVEEKNMPKDFMKHLWDIRDGDASEFIEKYGTHVTTHASGSCEEYLTITMTFSSTTDKSSWGTANSMEVTYGKAKVSSSMGYDSNSEKSKVEYTLNVVAHGDYDDAALEDCYAAKASKNVFHLISECEIAMLHLSETCTSERLSYHKYFGIAMFDFLKYHTEIDMYELEAKTGITKDTFPNTESVLTLPKAFQSLATMEKQLKGNQGFPIVDLQTDIDRGLSNTKSSDGLYMENVGRISVVQGMLDECKKIGLNWYSLPTQEQREEEVEKFKQCISYLKTNVDGAMSTSVSIALHSTTYNNLYMFTTSLYISDEDDFHKRDFVKGNTGKSTPMAGHSLFWNRGGHTYDIMYRDPYKEQLATLHNFGSTPVIVPYPLGASNGMHPSQYRKYLLAALQRRQKHCILIEPATEVNEPGIYRVTTWNDNYNTDYHLWSTIDNMDDSKVNEFLDPILKNGNVSYMGYTDTSQDCKGKAICGLLQHNEIRAEISHYGDTPGLT
eukprot:Nk52_evm6s282 gene=Nk52_evmTU6s282